MSANGDRIYPSIQKIQDSPAGAEADLGEIDRPRLGAWEPGAFDWLGWLRDVAWNVTIPRASRGHWVESPDYRETQQATSGIGGLSVVICDTRLPAQRHPSRWSTMLLRCSSTVATTIRPL